MDELQSRKASTIKAEPVKWLWPDVFPLKSLSILFGEPGVGKSQLTCALAAAVSKGSALPLKQGKAPKGNVLLMSFEDRAEDTVIPRLTAAGANMQNVHILGDVKAANGKRFFNMRRDVPLFAAKAKEVKNVRLIVIDPVMVYQGNVRDVTAALANLAGQTGACIIGVTHPAKGKDDRPLGSIAWEGQARAVYGVKRRGAAFLMWPYKGNLAAQQNAFTYSIEPHTLKGTRIRTSAACFSTVEEWVPVNGGDRPVDAAAAFLRVRLEDGALPSVELSQAAVQAGHKLRTVIRARDQLNVQSFQRDGKWFMELPGG